MSFYYPFAESWVLAAWGLWLALDGLAESCGRPALGNQPEAAVWALVISTFGWAGIDYLNEYFPTWTLLGFSFNPLVREISVGLLGTPVVPTVLAVASLLGPARWLALAAGAVTWAAFDALWSQIGPAERLYVGYAASAAILPAILAAGAVCVARLWYASG